MDDIKNFTEGTFHADCPLIELRREGENPLSVKGSGYIAQDDNGKLTFKIYVDNSGVTAINDDILRPRPIGKVIPRESYIQFKASSLSGPIWVSSTPVVNIRTGFDSGVAYGSLWEITKIDGRGDQEKDFVKLTMREKLDFPESAFTKTTVERLGDSHTSFHRNSAKFSVNDEEFMLVKNEELTELHCTFQKGGVQEFRHVRIREALQFALGQLIEPCVIQISANSVKQTALRSFNIQQNKTFSQQPPLSFRSHTFQADKVYEIAKAYYFSILPHKEEHWHRLSSHLYLLIEAGSVALEFKVLGMSIAAEGIADTCFRNLALPHKTFIDEIDDLLGTTLKKLELSQSLTSRLEGALGAMKSARNSDRLRSFVEQEKLGKEVFESWKALRNTAAHGGKIDLEKIDEVFEDLMSVLFLCYAMVLSHIGYAGPRTNYSKDGHPEYTPR